MASSNLRVKIVPEVEGIGALTDFVNVLADISDVQRLRLNPGDVLVVRARRDLTHEEAHRIHDAVARVVPGHEVLVLPPDLSLEVCAP